MSSNIEDPATRRVVGRMHALADDVDAQTARIRALPTPDPFRPRTEAQFTVTVYQEMSATGRLYYLAEMVDAGTGREVAWNTGRTVLQAAAAAARTAQEKRGC